MTSISRMDVVSDATDGPRLHAKVFIFGEQFAVVTSANLTTSALNSNIEVGVELKGSAVRELAEWFDSLWATRAKPLNLMQVAQWQQQTDALRRQFTELRNKAGALLTLPNEALLSGELPAGLRHLLDYAHQLFCCNAFPASPAAR